MSDGDFELSAEECAAIEAMQAEGCPEGYGAEEGGSNG